jgi:hypothetical protein
MPPYANRAWPQQSHDSESGSSTAPSHRNRTGRLPLYQAPREEPVRTTPAVGVPSMPWYCEGEAPDAPSMDDETDEHRLQQRTKQIMFGKVTAGYRNYVMTVPRNLRAKDDDRFPVTPRITRKVSKRSWDAYVSVWRRALHEWDTKPLDVGLRIVPDALRRVAAGEPMPATAAPVDGIEMPLTADGIVQYKAEVASVLDALRTRVEVAYPSAPLHDNEPNPRELAVGWLAQLDADIEQGKKHALAPTAAAAASAALPLTGTPLTSSINVKPTRSDPSKSLTPRSASGVLFASGTLSSAPSAANQSITGAVSATPSDAGDWSGATSEAQPEQPTPAVKRLTESGTARLSMRIAQIVSHRVVSTIPVILDCPDGGSAAELLAKLASRFDVHKLSFHVSRRTPPLTPPPPTSPQTPPQRTVAEDGESTPPFAQGPPGETKAEDPPAPPSFDVRPSPMLCTLHGTAMCTIYPLDNPGNAQYFLSFYDTGLPQLYYESPADVAVQRTAGGTPVCDEASAIVAASLPPGFLNPRATTPNSCFLFGYEVNQELKFGLNTGNVVVSGPPTALADVSRFFSSPIPLDDDRDLFDRHSPDPLSNTKSEAAARKKARASASSERSEFRDESLARE